MRSLSYSPPRTMEKFIASPSFGRLVAGPVGSGKTYGCIVELLRRCCEQEPGLDGLRHSRWAIVRQTLKQIKETLLPDIQRMMQGIEEFRVSDSSIRIWFADIRCTILLVPMEDVRDQQRLLSSQLTGVWISEAIEIDIELIGPISGRLARYPSGAHGTPTWTGIIADTNFPIEGSSWYDFMENPPITWSIFKQPSGLAKDAENLPWLNQTAETLKLPEDHPVRIALGRAYYQRLMDGSSDSYIRRYVKAEYGPDPSGTAVFGSTFKRNWHVVDNLEPVPSKMLMIGQDFGRNPAALICQMDHKGRLLVLEEIDSLEIGLLLHLTTRLRPALMDLKYFGKPIVLIGDPAGGAKDSLYEINSFDMLTNNHFNAYPAPTNDPDTRVRAVEDFLLGQRDGGPAILFDAAKCPRTIQGLSGAYKYEKSRDGELKPKPDKKRWSHLMDALQYVCLVANSPGAYMSSMRTAMPRHREKRNPMPVRAWT